jgi:hypothetical protein
MMRRSLLPIAIGVGLSIISLPAEAQLRTQTVVSGLSELVAFVPDPLSPGVFYAVQQGGLIRTVQNGVVLPAPFLDVRAACAFAR